MRREQRQQISEALSSSSPDLVKDLVKETRGRIEKKINPSRCAPLHNVHNEHRLVSRFSNPMRGEIEGGRRARRGTEIEKFARFLRRRLLADDR